MPAIGSRAAVLLGALAGVGCAGFGDDDGGEACAAATPEALSEMVVVRTDRAPCSLELTPLFRLAIDEGGNSPDVAMPVMATRDGHFLAASTGHDMVTRWSPDGALDTVLAARGEGPGEFRSVGVVYVDPYDTVHVVEQSARWHVLDPELNWVRTIHGTVLAFSNGVAFLKSGAVVLGAPNANLTGRAPLALIDRADGHVLTAITGDEGSGERVVAYGGGDTFWAASPTRYELFQYDLAGKSVGSIRREVNWFHESDETRREPVASRIGLMHVDESGVLWVTVAQVHTDRTSRDSRAPEFRLEAFDRSGRLLVSERYTSDEELILSYLPRSRGIRFRPLPSGVTAAEVVSYRLTEKQ